MASIHHRDGRWRVHWRHGGRQHVRTFVSEDHATRLRSHLELVGHALALQALTAPPPELPTTTVGQVVAEHVDSLTGITDGTRRRYRALAARHIEPSLGQVPVAQLVRRDVAGWVNDLTAAELAGKSIRNVHSLLSAALASAVRDNLTPQNAAKGLRLPSTRREEEMVFLDVSELQRLVELTPSRWRMLVTTLATTGMRWGEASALTVGDLDFTGGRVRIRQAWQHTAGRGHRLGPPKSRRGRRTIAMPVPVRAGLAQQCEGRSPGEFVFLNSLGRPVRHGSFHSHVWQPLVHEFAGDERLETGVPGRRRFAWREDGHGKRPRLHDLRHTFASLAASAGMSMTALQRHMGHESIQTTADTYGHLYQADWDAFASVIRVDPEAVESEVVAVEPPVAGSGDRPGGMVRAWAGK